MLGPHGFLFFCTFFLHFPFPSCFHGKVGRIWMDLMTDLVQHHSLYQEMPLCFLFPED
jgi:hypothetical protein